MHLQHTYSLHLLSWVWFRDKSSPLFCSCNSAGTANSLPSFSVFGLPKRPIHAEHWTLACSICCWKPPLLTEHSCFQFPHHMHASSWLSVLPSQGLGLHLDAPVHQVAIKWWPAQGLDLAHTRTNRCHSLTGMWVPPILGPGGPICLGNWVPPPPPPGPKCLGILVRVIICTSRHLGPGRGRRGGPSFLMRFIYWHRPVLIR